MSVSLGSFLMALVTLFVRLIDFFKIRNAKIKNDEYQSLRRNKGDLEKLLLAIKIRRKIRNEKSHIGNIAEDITDGTSAVADRLRKSKNRYQRQ